jgi:hypothetical protein
MKKTLTLWGLLLLFYCGFAQDSNSSITTRPNITVKWAPLGLFLGNISLQAEYNFGGKNSLTAKIGLPVRAHHSFTFEDKDAEFTMKAMSFLAGYRTYLSRKHLRGWYYEPFFKYVHHTSEGTGTGSLNNRVAMYNFTNDYNGVGIGVQLGYQFIIGKQIVIDLFLGPEINSASNSFKAIEVGNSMSWTYWDGHDVENDVRNFIDQFPVIRNKTNVVVDQANKRVLADFDGALPGLRTGVSIGFAF